MLLYIKKYFVATKLNSYCCYLYVKYSIIYRNNNTIYAMIATLSTLILLIMKSFKYYFNHFIANCKSRIFHENTIEPYHYLNAVLEQIEDMPYEKKIMASEYYRKIEDITFQNKNVPKDLRVTINKIHQDIGKLMIHLKPIIDLGFISEIGICGGSVRDIVLGKYTNIKDIDICISLNYEKFYTVLMDIQDGNIENYKHSHLLKKLSFYKKLNSDDQLHNLIFVCIHYYYDSHIYEKNHSITIGEDLRPYTLTHRLKSVIKVDDDALNYPCDLLLTHLSLENYVNQFDFNICKAYICLMDDELIFSHVAKPLQYIHKIEFKLDFLEDVMQKKLTLDMATRYSINDVENSLGAHFSRLQDKYPDYSLDMMPGDNPEYVIYRNYYMLSRDLSHSLIKRVKRQVKI